MEAEKDEEDTFVVLAENEEGGEGFGIVQFESSTRLLVYVGRKSSAGRFYRASIPPSAFFELAREVLAKLDAGEIEVE